MKITRLEGYFGKTFIFGKYAHVRGQQWEKHVLDRPGLLLSLHGRGEISFGGDTHVIEEGECIFYTSLPRHTFSVLRDWSYLYCHMPETLTREIQTIPCNTKVANVWSVRFKRNLLAKVKIEMQEAFSSDSDVLAEALVRLLLTRFQLALPTLQKQQASRLGQARQKLDTLIPVALADLAKEYGFSQSDFFRKFRKEFGCSPNEYRAHLLLGKAKVLLASTDFQIKEIARILNFQDPYYFSRFFFKHTGNTPSFYRAKSAREISRMRA